MATQLDCYGILQVHPKAEKEVIDAVYRRLAAKYHPDVSQLSVSIDLLALLVFTMLFPIVVMNLHQKTMPKRI